MKYKVGEKAKVRKDLKIGEYYGGYLFNNSMSELKGNSVTISYTGLSSYSIRESDRPWSEEMFEPVGEEEQIVKYKAGDKVRVRSDLEACRTYGGIRASSTMCQYRGKTVEIAKVYSNYYKIKERDFYWTDEMFESEEEMSAEEALKMLKGLCEEYPTCNGCPLRNPRKDDFMGCMIDPKVTLKVLKQWKADHEKKSIETEFVNIVRVIEDTGTVKKCVYEERLPDGELNLSDKQVEVLRKYCEEHKGKYFTVVERICKVKE